jgi:hypothetical protein
MDRIYYTYDYQKDLFLLYANYKNYKNFYNHYYNKFTISDIIKNEKYPYMDTFMYFSPNENILQNKAPNNKFILLRNI